MKPVRCTPVPQLGAQLGAPARLLLQPTPMCEEIAELAISLVSAVLEVIGEALAAVYRWMGQRLTGARLRRFRAGAALLFLGVLVAAVVLLARAEPPDPDPCRQLVERLGGSRSPVVADLGSRLTRRCG